MYMNCIIKSRYYIRKGSKKTKGKGVYIIYLVAGLTGTVLCTGQDRIWVAVLAEFGRIRWTWQNMAEFGGLSRMWQIAVDCR